MKKKLYNALPLCFKNIINDETFGTKMKDFPG